jgi:hypothetical protein
MYITSNVYSDHNISFIGLRIHVKKGSGYFPSPSLKEMSGFTKNHDPTPTLTRSEHPTSHGLLHYEVLSSRKARRRVCDVSVVFILLLSLNRVIRIQVGIL